MDNVPPSSLIAVACGGTGGHLFPGMALAEELGSRGSDLMLLVSAKDIDQQAARSIWGMRVETLPGVGLERRGWLRFLRGLRNSYRLSLALFRERPPAAVIAMGGFTSVGPVLAGKRIGAATFIHEANAIPGRANRWLAHLVEEAFVYFPDAAGRLWNQQVRVSGMPVRSQFTALEPASCRVALGLDADRPTLLVTGGSQGATPLNDRVLGMVPGLLADQAAWQFIHLTGVKDEDRVRAAYATLGARALVRPFLTEMELALGAATLAISRAGASSLAEQAAMRVPTLLVPLPHAVDNHQTYNARAFFASGAASVLAQADATPGRLLAEVRNLIFDTTRYHGMKTALRQWHSGDAAKGIADVILRRVAARPARGQSAGPPPGPTVGGRLGYPGVKAADKA